MSAKTASLTICVLAFLALSGCGVDGEPQAPPPKTETSTSATIGVGSNGVTGGVASTISRGNVSLPLGTGTGRYCRGSFWGRCW